jgi:Cell wall-active antibiotics response 4TMS YvqF/Domain of unknown function (DUF1707)
MSGGDSRVSLVLVRDRRERAIQHLSDSFVADTITVEEFEDRLARVHAASTLADVDAQVTDLAPLPAGATSTALAPLSVNPALAVATKRIRTVLGNVERRGGWAVPTRLDVSATFGNVELDFRGAQFTAAVTELNARVVFGNLEIIVPPQLAVDCEGSSVLGNIENHGSGAVSDPDRPLLRIRGVVVLGNISVRTRLPGESAGDAHRRGKREGHGLPGAGEGRPASLGPIRHD